MSTWKGQTTGLFTVQTFWKLYGSSFGVTVLVLV